MQRTEQEIACLLPVLAYNAHMFSCSDSIVKTMVRAEKAERITALAERAERSASCNDTKDLFLVMRIISRNACHKFPSVKDENGSIVSEPKLIARRWQAHFASKLGGAVTNQNALLCNASVTDRIAFSRMSAHEYSTRSVPSFSQLYG